MAPHRIAVIAEGKGDCDAIVDLAAKAASHRKISNLIFDPRVIRGGCVNRISKDIERLVVLARARPKPADFVLVVVDCEDICAVTAAKEIGDQWRQVIQKRADVAGGAIALLVKEYEMAFLADLVGLKVKLGDEIGPFDLAIPNNCEQYRDAKGTIARICKSGYKPTRDQRNLTKQLDCTIVETKSRSFRHFLGSLGWLSTQKRGTKAVYP